MQHAELNSSAAGLQSKGMHFLDEGIALLATDEHVHLFHADVLQNSSKKFSTRKLGGCPALIKIQDFRRTRVLALGRAALMGPPDLYRLRALPNKIRLLPLDQALQKVTEERYEPGMHRCDHCQFAERY